MIDIRCSNIDWFDFYHRTKSDSWKKRQKDESVKDFLDRVSLPSNCLEVFEWRRNNEYWLNSSFKISLTILIYLRKNNISVVELYDLCGFEFSLKGDQDFKLSEIKKIELVTGIKFEL